MPLGPSPYPIVIRGRRFESARAAADAYGISPSTVYWMLGKGRADRIGLGKGRTKTIRTHWKARPVCIAGTHYPSMAAASRAFGCAPKYLSRALAQGRSPHRILEDLLARHVQQTAAHP